MIPRAAAMLGAEIGNAAQSFAGTLSALEQTLLPIPQDAIEDVLSRASRATIH